MLQIRNCMPEDGEEISRINREVMGYDYPPEQTKEKIKALSTNQHHLILVAELRGRIAGYIHLNDYDTLYFGPMKNVLCLAVLPEYRRQGIAGALLKKAESLSKESSTVGIRLDSGAERLPAHACYEKYGYINIKDHKYFRKMF